MALRQSEMPHSLLQRPMAGNAGVCVCVCVCGGGGGGGGCTTLLHGNTVKLVTTQRLGQCFLAACSPLFPFLFHHSHFSSFRRSSPGAPFVEEAVLQNETDRLNDEERELLSVYHKTFDDDRVSRWCCQVSTHRFTPSIIASYPFRPPCAVLGTRPMVKRGYRKRAR